MRPIRPDDAPRLIALYDRLSRDSRYQRFFTVMRRLPPDWARLLATVDFQRRFAIVLERRVGDDAEVIAVARYEPTAAADEVELAFAVEDPWQGRGLGTLLVRELLRAAAANGYERLRAYVLADNRRMLSLMAREADVRNRSLERGVVSLLLAPRKT